MKLFTDKINQLTCYNKSFQLRVREIYNYKYINKIVELVLEEISIINNIKKKSITDECEVKFLNRYQFNKVIKIKSNSDTKNLLKKVIYSQKGIIF